jgi:chromosome partition protein MukF
MSDTSRSHEHVLSAIAEQKLSLELSTLDIGFLVSLHLQGQAAGLSSFSEPQLEAAFEQACAIIAPEAEQRARRATFAIQRLRDQRLLARVDGQGVVRSGEFALSRLASGIVDFYLEQDVLTRESLVLLTSGLRAALTSVCEAARLADDAAAWRERVIGPLRVTIAELIAGIERRQRGLDLQQQDLQAELRRMLESDWFAALARCQGLLETTSATLQELNRVLLHDTSELLAVLHDIEELAIAAGAAEAEAEAQRAIDHIDRIAAWGSSRQRAFSEYFQYVHRYLRDVVRLDPARALTQRLRDQLAGSGVRFALAYAGAPPLAILRTTAAAPEKPAVSRPRAQREKEPAADSGEDPQLVLREKVRASLAAGAAALSQVTRDVTDELEPAERFLEAGRVAHTVAQLAKVQSAVERPWVSAGDELLIEEWSLPEAVDE